MRSWTFLLCLLCWLLAPAGTAHASSLSAAAAHRNFPAVVGSRPVEEAAQFLLPGEHAREASAARTGKRFPVGPLETLPSALRSAISYRAAHPRFTRVRTVEPHSHPVRGPPLR